MKKVTLYKITKQHIMIGDRRSIVEIRGFTDLGVAPIAGSADVAAPYATTEEILSVPIEEVRFPNGTSQFIALHPKDKEKINLFVEQSQINRLELGLQSAHEYIYKVKDASLWARFKWLFTGVKL